MRYVQNPVSEGSKTQRDYLLQFLNYHNALVLGYAVFNTIMVFLYRDIAIAFCGLAFYVYLGYSRFITSRIEKIPIEDSSSSVAIGLIVLSITIAIGYPAAAQGAAIIPLGVVAMVLPYLTAKPLIRIIVLSGSASIIISLIGEFWPSWTTAPDWLVSFYRINSVPVGVVIVLILLWQFHRRLTLAISDLHIANDSLKREMNLRNQAEMEREKIIKELEIKNQELEQFTYTVSHDLKSPLITIGSYTEYLVKDVEKGDNKRIEQDITHIRNAHLHMTDLLDDLLELSRIGRIDYPVENLQLKAVIQDAIKLLQDRINRSETLLIVDEDLPEISGDRRRLITVFQNLIENAIKFTQDNVVPQIEIKVIKHYTALRCSVCDNGIGIQPDYHDRVFGLFERLNPDKNGTGIGLAIVKRIVELHGGKIWIESSGINQGTCVYFELPMVKE